MVVFSVLYIFTLMNTVYTIIKYSICHNSGQYILQLNTVYYLIILSSEINAYKKKKQKK